MIFIRVKAFCFGNDCSVLAVGVDPLPQAHSLIFYFKPIGGAFSATCGQTGDKR
jgi:hypothetical protein